MMTVRSIGISVVAAALAHASGVHAQAAAPSADIWPARAIRLVIGAAPGASPDIVGRLIGKKLGERLKQPVVIDNRVGAFGNIAMEATVRAAPDGYTILLGIPSVAINPHLYSLNFDPMADLMPVAKVTSVTFTLIAHPEFEPRSVPEIIAAARAKPGKVSCAWAGPIPQFGCEMLRLRGNIDLNVVPYKSQAQALNDLVGGQVNMLFETTNVAAPQAKAGRVRPIATTNALRGAGPFGDLPILNETFPGFVFEGWQGVFLPAKAPREIAFRLNREIGAVLEDPDIRKRLTDGGLGVETGTVEAFGETVRRDHAAYGKIIRDAGIKAE